MTNLTRLLPLALLLALATPAIAQTTTEDSATGDAAAPDALALSMGAEAQPGEPAVGDVYIDSTYDDWELRCVKADAETDPCQLYQLLKDPNGNPVAEINIFALGGEGRPAAGATVITPLETLLTQQLGISVDGGPVKKYPFSWCSQVGCFSRIGLSGEEVDAFKRGINATLTIVPVAAADQLVNLTVSLKGFTAAFAAVTDEEDPH